MAEKRVRIAIKHGLHMRPVTKIVRTASKVSDDIFMYKGDKEADAKSIMAIIMLEAQKGEEVRIVSENVQVLSEIENILKQESP